MGEHIDLYVTGGGSCSVFEGVACSLPALPLSVIIGGQDSGQAAIYEREAPGVSRIVALVPSGITPGNAVPVIVQVGNTPSQSGVTIAVAGR